MSSQRKEQDAFIGKEAIERIARDTKSLLRDPLDSVCYVRSVNRVDRGYVMILGTENTPYYCIPMLFSLSFPTNYPYGPPSMTFITGVSTRNGTSSSTVASHVRMHPNYYVNGKCCLSLLNNWEGEKWSSCQSLRSVFATISMTLTDQPLENEPGYSRSYAQSAPYCAVVADAGLRWLTHVLEKPPSLRVTANDEENPEIIERMHSFLVTHLKSGHGRRLIEMLRDDESYLGKCILPYDNTNMTPGVYRILYRMDYGKTKERLIPLIERILAEN